MNINIRSNTFLFFNLSKLLQNRAGMTLNNGLIKLNLMALNLFMVGCLTNKKQTIRELLRNFVIMSELQKGLGVGVAACNRNFGPVRFGTSEVWFKKNLVEINRTKTSVRLVQK